MNFGIINNAIMAGKAGAFCGAMPTESHILRVEKALIHLGKSKADFPLQGVELKTAKLNIMVAKEHLSYRKQYLENNFDFWGAVRFLRKIKKNGRNG